MPDKKGINEWRIVLAVMAVVLAAAIVGAMVSNWGHAEKTPEGGAGAPSIPRPEAPLSPENTSPPAISAPQPGQKPTLAQIAARARTWEPHFVEYIGKPAPEFRARDLDGKTHKLSDYRGRDVLIIFWAMWCAPCREEIPYLIKLRQDRPEDKLAMLAVSTDRISDDPIINNSMQAQLIQKLKDFVAARKMNYTILLMPPSGERPYSRISSLPSAIFVSPDGTIKMGTTGYVPLQDIEAILAAER